MLFTFEDFIASDFRNMHVYEDGGNLEVYVRKATRVFPEGKTNLDLARMSAHVRGTGSLTRFLDKIEAEHSIYIENIFEERLCNFLERRGYKYAPVHEFFENSLPCMYKVVGSEYDSTSVQEIPDPVPEEIPQPLVASDE